MDRREFFGGMLGLLGVGVASAAVSGLKLDLAKRSKFPRRSDPTRPPVNGDYCLNMPEGDFFVYVDGRWHLAKL